MKVTITHKDGTIKEYEGLDRIHANELCNYLYLGHKFDPLTFDQISAVEKIEIGFESKEGDGEK